MNHEAPIFDLHCHTFHSDGLNSPEEMLLQAEKIGLDYLAITDHNTTDGLIDLLESTDLRQHKTKVIPGFELSLLQGHYLILGVDPYLQKKQLHKWGLTKGSYAHLVSYEGLVSYLSWSLDQKAFIIVAHPCMPTLFMSTQYHTLQDLYQKGLIHGAESHNHDVERHYGLLYHLYHRYLDSLLTSSQIPRFTNSDAHDLSYLGRYTNSASSENTHFLSWLAQNQPFLSSHTLSPSRLSETKTPRSL